MLQESIFFSLLTQQLHCHIGLGAATALFGADVRGSPREIVTVFFTSESGSDHPLGASCDVASDHVVPCDAAANADTGVGTGTYVFARDVAAMSYGPAVVLSVAHPAAGS